MSGLSGPLALVADDPDGGFLVVDTRDGRAIAWRGHLPDVAGITAQLNAHYPPGTPAPAYDSLIHEVVMERIAGRALIPLRQLEASDLARMIPAAIDGPTDSGLWRPPADEELV